MLKKVLGTMFTFAIVMIFGGGAISMVIMKMVGGGVAESYIYPIYGGVILLAGLVVGCTCVVLDEFKEIRNQLEERRS